jgi:putative PIN family toxin of toxin-antitoxin system
MTAGPASRPRVVLDTNVVLSALLFGNGRLAALRGAWQQARCQPLVSGATAGELLRALAYPKFKLSADEQEQLLADYLPYCTTVRMPTRAPRTPACRDPADLPFLQLAIIGKADCLVSGDRDLLAVTGPFPCLIVTAAAFLQSLAGSG